MLLKCSDESLNPVRGEHRQVDRRVLTMANPFFVEQTRFTEASPFSSSVRHHPSISSSTTQQGVHQNLLRERERVLNEACLCVDQRQLQDLNPGLINAEQSKITDCFIFLTLRSEVQQPLLSIQRVTIQFWSSVFKVRDQLINIQHFDT